MHIHVAVLFYCNKFNFIFGRSKYENVMVVFSLFFLLCTSHTSYFCFNSLKLFGFAIVCGQSIQFRQILIILPEILLLLHSTWFIGTVWLKNSLLNCMCVGCAIHFVVCMFVCASFRSISRHQYIICWAIICFQKHKKGNEHRRISQTL